MSNRTKYKLRKAKLSFRKNVLSEGLSVRNILAVLTIVALTFICGFSVMVAKENIQNDLAKAPKKEAVKEVTTEEVKKAEAEPETEAVTYEIELEETEMLDSELLSANLESMEGAAPDKEAVENKNLTASLDEGEFVVTVDALNIRESASKDSEIVGHIYKGMTGKIEDDSDSDWIEIKSGDVTGFVKKEYISLEADESIISHLATVTADNVNIRSQANSNSNIICTAKNGEVYPAVSDSDSEWSEVVLPDGSKAYINNSYLEIAEGKANAVSSDDVAVFGTKCAEYAAANAKPEEKDDTETAKNDVTESTTEAPKGNTNTTEKKQETTKAAPAEATTKAPATTQAPTTEATTQAPTSASASDFELICAVVYSESGHESYEGQLAVANVILNRLRSGRWGGSIRDVLYAPNQFSCVNGARFKNALGGNVPSTTSQAVQAALNGNNNIGNFMSFRPTWYLDPNSLSNCKVIGNHVFF